jgi:hypothetical protein
MPSDCDLPDQLVELLDHFTYFGSQLIVAARGGGLAAGDSMLNTLEGALCALERN